MADSTPQPAASPSATAPAEAPARNWLVSLSIISTFILFFSFVTILAVKWVYVPVPNSVLEIVNVPASLDGMAFHIEGAELPEPLEYEITPELRGDNNRVRIYLSDGIYRLSIKKGVTTVYAESFIVKSRNGIRFDFKRLGDTLAARAQSDD